MFHPPFSLEIVTKAPHVILNVPFWPKVKLNEEYILTVYTLDIANLKLIEQNNTGRSLLPSLSLFMDVRKIFSIKKLYCPEFRNY